MPYEVRDLSQPGQLTIYNAHRGGGTVGMPLHYGDVNGDGHGDFIACPMLADSGPERERRNSGEVHIYFGTGVIAGTVVNTPAADGITTLMGARAGDLLGTKPYVYDFNTDGFDDVLVGAENYDGPAGDRRNAGGVFLYYGRAQNARSVDLATPPEGVVVITGPEEGDRLGVWVTGGDVDGDGALDLVLGADQADGPANDRPDAGAIYVVFGGQQLPAAIDLATPGNLRTAVIHGIDPGDHFGSTIAAADVDGDGKDDILAAGGLARGSSQIEGTFMAGGDGPANDRPEAGEVYLLYSRGKPLPPELDVAAVAAEDRLTIYGAAPAHVTGEELVMGDLNGDGRVDLALGSLQATGPQGSRGLATGRTYIVFDAARRRGDMIDLAVSGPGVTTIFGRTRGSISGDTLIIADMDGDGTGDLWDAAPMQGTRDPEGDFRPGAGIVDILFGEREWPAVIDLLLPPDGLRLVQIRGADDGDMLGYSMALGDANGDGTFDVISNAMGGDGLQNTVRDAGELYVLANQVLFDTSPAIPAPLFLNIDIQPIFAAACLPCHGGTAPAAELRLDTVQNSVLDLLGRHGDGRKSTQVDALLVRAGDPDGSYLIEKLEATSANPPQAGDPMPPPPFTQLSRRVIADIRRWISEGAQPANEPLPPPPPTPAPPTEGFATTFFSRVRFVLADPAFGEIESALIEPPARIPFRIIGPRLTVPAAEWKTATLPSDFGDVDVIIRDDGTGTIDRAGGAAELAITFIQLSVGGTVETMVPVILTTGSQSAGPFSSQGQPLDPAGGTLKLAGIGNIPEDTPTIGGDFVLVELEGSIAPLLPAVPGLTEEIQFIFTRNCALANCHIGAGAANLNLEAGRSFAELVNQPSTQVSELLVVPGDPDRSYLHEKVTSDTPRAGDRMPIGNVLDALDLEAIRSWIAGGAPE